MRKKRLATVLQQGELTLTALPQTLYTHTHTHTFNGPLSGTTRASRYQKGNTSLDYTEETVNGSGISWTICKSAPRSRQITTPAHHHSIVFYRPDALPAARQSTEGTRTEGIESPPDPLTGF